LFYIFIFKEISIILWFFGLILICYIEINNIRTTGVPPSGGPVWMLMHGGPLVYGHHSFRRWWSIAQGALGPDSIAMAAPALDEDLGLA
jgi:hypothetical protein